MTEPEIVLLDDRVDGTVALITLNRPERMNAICTATVDAMDAVLDRIEATPRYRCIVMTGAGERAFCTGADLKERAGMTADAWKHQHRLFEQMFHRIRNVRRPLIAAINGFALGGGLELAMQADILVASTNATFGQPEVARGLIPGSGGTQFLPRRIPAGMALQLLLTGDHMDAAQALRLGLVNDVVPSAELLPLAENIAARIARNSPLAVQQAKKATRLGNDAPIEQAIGIELECYQPLIDHPDRYEGIKAFNEKRQPRFQDA